MPAIVRFSRLNLGMTNKSVVVIDPEIMSGEPVFAGTRVPVRSLIDHIQAGDSLDIFLEHFPSVTREQAISFLEEANDSLMASWVAV
jgi:uncharacterized protein (DUF433 family)